MYLLCVVSSLAYTFIYDLRRAHGIVGYIAVISLRFEAELSRSRLSPLLSTLSRHTQLIGLP